MNVIAQFFNRLTTLNRISTFTFWALVTLQTGCVTDKSSVKDNFRMAPLKMGYAQSTQVHPNPPILIFDEGALTSKEHQALIDELTTLQPLELPQRATTAQESLAMQLNSCRVFVNVGRVHTHYRAVCDAELNFDTHALLHLSASAERETRTKGLPPSVVKKVSARNPWMDHQHVKAVTLFAAQKALQHLYLPSTTTAPSFYFTPKKMADALKENNVSILRAIISRMTFRHAEEDISFLLKVTSGALDEIKVDAVRTLAIRCTNTARSVFEQHAESKAPIGVWANRGLACLEAEEKGLMPRRETIPVEGPDS